MEILTELDMRGTSNPFDELLSSSNAELDVPNPTECCALPGMPSRRYMIKIVVYFISIPFDPFKPIHPALLIIEVVFLSSGLH